MSRHDESIGRIPNPSQYYLEWNIQKNSFCYYSAEKEERIPFPLPFKFLALKFLNTITGFDEHTKQGLYANEVTDTRLEHFKVCRRDGSVVATGLYNSIKDQVEAAGGKFTRSIYAITAKGVIVNVRLRGSQMFNFSVIEKHGNRWRDEWLQVATFDTKTHGEGEQAKIYTVPVFSFAGTLSPQDVNAADQAYKLVKDYFDSKPAFSQRQSTAPQSAPQISIPGPVTIPFASTGNDDDLPF